MCNRTLSTWFPRAVCFCAILCLASSVALAAAGPAPSPRVIIPFDAGWRFSLGDDPAARQTGFDDKNWRTLDLPHDWSIEGPFNPPPEGDANSGFFTHGIGWYRKSFTLPPTATGRKVVVEFDGVYMNSDVWINGKFLGRRPYGFIGFRYDLTQFLNTDGSPNVLAVRVDDSVEPSTRWYSGSGIYRHVRLIATGYTQFRLDGGIRITTPEVTPGQAAVEANYIIDANFFSDAEQQSWARNSWGFKSAKRAAVLRSSVLAPDGTVIASAESSITLESMQPGQFAVQRVTVPRPRLWSDAAPELYQLRSTLMLNGTALDEAVTPFGIRKLEFIPERGLLVNGRPTKLKGVCLHQDAASFGNAVPAAVWALRLARLKEMGCNAIRPSHHPFAPEFYDLCDRLGFYVFDEAFDEWTRDWPYNFTEDPRGKAPFGYHLYFKQWHDTDLRAMLRRDRNHPCVVLWSIGNEVPNQLDRDGYKIAQELIAICHEEDPTRPATSACDQSRVASRNGFMDALDIMGYNYIDRLYQTSSYAPEHARFQRRLLLGTETGPAIHMWLGVRDHDYVIGEFIWTGIDYLGEAGSLPRRGSSSGFIDLAGGKKPAFYQRAAYWREDPVLGLSVSDSQNPGSARSGKKKAATSVRTVFGSPSWNWPAAARTTVRAATNCDQVELFLNNKSLGRHAVSRDLYATTWTVAYVPGTLSAVGYRAGRQVATQQLVTAGEPARLQLAPLPSPLSGDLAFFEITVVDAAGLGVQSATPAVTVRVEGPGRLIGLDTGDLTYGGLFKTATRNACEGRLLATVRRTSPSGEVRINATAPGLTAATLRAR